MNITIKNEPPSRSESNSSASVSASEMSKIIAEAVAEALKIAIPAAAVGINQANAQAAEKSREYIIRESMKRTQRCPICAQPTSACGGAWQKDKEGKDIIVKDKDDLPDYSYTLHHEKAYVGPRDPNLYKWFQGVRVNGIRYLPDYYGHLMWIPKKSDILTTVAAWEQNEHELMQKRTAEGQGAGTIGPGGSVMRGPQQAQGWR